MATGSNNSSDTCSICTEKFNHPKILPCFHTFCLDCLQQFVSSSSKNGQFLCPLCRYQVTLPEKGVTGFQTNFYIETRAENQVHSGGECCGVCEQRATHSCRECEILLCNTCTKSHRIVPVSRSHMLINLGDSCTGESFLSMPKYCEKHKDEKLRFYCMPCSKVICRDCKLTDHEVHKTKDIADVVEEARTSLTKTKVELEACKAKLEKYIGQINNNNTETSKRISHVKEEINEFAESLFDMIINVQHEEIDRVTDIENTHTEKCSEVQYRLTQRKCFLQSQIDHMDAMLKGGLDCDVLTANSEMKQRLAEIEKEQQSDPDCDSKCLKISLPSVDRGLLDVARCVVSKVFPVSRNLVCLLQWENVRYDVDPVHAISITKTQNVLSVQGQDCHLCLFGRSSSTPIWKFRVDLDEVINKGFHGVIEKYNKENPDNKISADDYTDLKKSFPYKDTNENGDTCWVIKEYNRVGIQTVSGDVRTLTFNPYAGPGQEFRPVDVFWGNNQKIYILDSDADMIIVYSLQYGFQKSFTVPFAYGPTTAVVMDTDGKFWVGDSWGQIHVYSVY